MSLNLTEEMQDSLLAPGGQYSAKPTFNHKITVTFNFQFFLTHLVVHQPGIRTRKYIFNELNIFSQKPDDDQGNPGQNVVFQ